MGIQKFVPKTVNNSAKKKKSDSNHSALLNNRYSVLRFSIQKKIKLLSPLVVAESVYTKKKVSSWKNKENFFSDDRYNSL